MIPCGELAPDQPIWNNPDAAETILNVLPDGAGYKPMPSPVDWSDAIPSDVGNPDVRGGIALQHHSALVYIVGTAARLWKLDTSTLAWTNVTRLVGGTYSVPGGVSWSAQAFGDFVVFVNFNNTPQVIDLAAGGNFADLGGNPPNAKSVWRANNFLFLGHTEDDPQEVRHSDFNAINIWKWGLSSRQRIPTGGDVVGGIGDERGCWVFMDRAIKRWEYTSAKPAFAMSDVADGIGCISRPSICNIGARVFWISQDGPYELGDPPRPIGDKRIAATFMAGIDAANQTRIQGIGNSLTGVVYWFYPVFGGGTNRKTAILVYSTKEDRFAIVNIPGFWLLPPLPSAAEGTHPALMTVDSILAYFNGPNLAATIETGVAQLHGEGLRQRVNGARPLVDTTAATLAVGRTETPGGTFAWTSDMATNRSGFVPVRRTGRFLRGRLKIPAATAWTHAQGLEDIVSTPAGSR